MENETVNLTPYLEHLHPLFGRHGERDRMADDAMLALAHVMEGVDPNDSDPRTTKTREWIHQLRSSELIIGADGNVPSVTILGEIVASAFLRGQASAQWGLVQWGAP